MDVIISRRKVDHKQENLFSEASIELSKMAKQTKGKGFETAYRVNQDSFEKMFIANARGVKKIDLLRDHQSKDL